MNIKCPNCETGYEVPDDRIGDKPKKMRCSRCEEVFTVTRRDADTPEGYKEFTGQQEALPKEFAYLKAQDKDVSLANLATPVPQMREDGPPPIPAIPPPIRAEGSAENEGQTDGARSGFESFAPHADPTRMSGGSGFESFAPHADPGQTQPGFGAGLPVAAAPEPVNDASPIAHQKGTTQVGPPPKAPTPKSAPAPNGAPPPVQGAVQQPVHDIYGSSSWEMEAPMDLGDYAAPSAKSQKIGKIVGIATGVVVLLLLFVMYRNGWSLSLGELPSQFAFAFSGGEREDYPDEVGDLETLVSEKRILTAGSKTYLIVTGTIFNNSPVRRSEIMLRGKLVDSTGDVRATVEAPCDKVIEDDVIKRTSSGQMGNHYNKGGRPHNCVIKGETSSVYQLVFETPPADYSASFNVVVIPIFAK